MGTIRQVRTLVGKDLLIVLVKRWLSTALRALALPIVYMWFISYVRNFFMPPSVYGFGAPRPIRNLTSVFEGTVGLGGRDTVAFVHNGFTGGQIDSVISSLASPLSDLGVNTPILASDNLLFEACQSSLRGTSRCYSAISLHGSPTEGSGGRWNYTIISDFSLGQQVYVDQDDNDAEIFALPFIQAVNSQVASLSGTSIPADQLAYPFTTETVEDRDNQIHRFFMRALVNYLGVVFFIGICGVAYHLPGNLSAERESGMSQLIDVMVPARHHGTTHMLRLLSKHIAFDLIYLPGWLSIGAIVSTLVFGHTATSIVVLYHLLAGLSLTGYSIFGGTLFSRAQLSGITILISSLVLAIVAQFIINSTAVAVALSLIFPSVNYTLFIIYLASWERLLRPANLLEGPPGMAGNTMPGYLYFVLLVAQVVVYPILASVSEYCLHGTSSQGRNTSLKSTPRTPSIIIEKLCKHYRPSVWQGRSSVIKAVHDVSFNALKGEIVILLGANGSGKSTTLSAVSGVHSITSGNVQLDGSGGLGLCPQKNVMWDDMTVLEHVRVFNRLKTQGSTDTTQELSDLISGCDLKLKMNKKAKTLSGGQKRKLQLAMAFTGGSQVCCIDEVSSGIDPLSRRKIWEILLAEKGRRTLLLATHALDEADALSDGIVVLSKGNLRAQGSSVELKHNSSRGYRVLCPTRISSDDQVLSRYRLSSGRSGDVLTATDAADAIHLMSVLEQRGIRDCLVFAPTIEDAFMDLAEEVKEESTNTAASQSSLELDTVTGSYTAKGRFDLVSGNGTSFLRQTWIIFSKRLRILTRNFLPYICALLVPIVTAGLATFFLAGFDGLTCVLGANANNPNVQTLAVVDYWWGLNIPLAPTSNINPTRLSNAVGQFTNRIVPVADFDGFQAFIQENFRDVNPGGVYLGNTSSPAPILAYRANGGLQYAALAKIAMDSYFMDQSIIAQVSTFALPLAGSTGDSLQLVLYFTFAMCAACGFFALYPTFERISKVRALHYSNGVRPAPLWLANILYDSIFVLIISTVAIALFVGLSDLWYEPGYLFTIFFLFGISSTMLSYIVSLFVTSQLAAFAFAAGGQAVFGLIYFILYMVLITYSQPESLLDNLNTVQFVYGLITPSGNLLRTMLLTLNQSQLLCRGQSYIAYPGDIEVYGGPILYLLLQIIAAYAFLVCYDNGWRVPALASLGRSRRSNRDLEQDAETKTLGGDVAAEVARTEASNDGLRVLHIDKRFGKDLVLDDVTFGVQHGEVFALLGPNGAGKSTTISLIRGDLKPSSTASDLLIEGASIRTHRRAARRHLGVCPQFDAMDRMTVVEHLRFYAKARGVPNVDHNVDQVISAVGLQPFRMRLAAKLSGGNQRKLSLGIAIIGNPSILLLDEPSSGMDAVAKRVMWRVLENIKIDRSLLMTTHSMEEASALSDRVGILAKKMLAVGTVDALRNIHGDAFYVHLVHAHGPAISDHECHRVEQWITTNIPAATMESSTFHGQFRFVVPKTLQRVGETSNVGGLLLRLLEENKEALNIKYYSFSETTLEDVFLTVVGKHRVVEENL